MVMVGIALLESDERRVEVVRRKGLLFVMLRFFWGEKDI